MVNYEAPSFEIKTDARTHVLETASDVFYIFDADGIVSAIERGSKVQLESYGYTEGIVVSSDLSVVRGENLNGKLANLYTGELGFDPSLSTDGVGDVFRKKLHSNLEEVADSTEGTFAQRFHWTNNSLIVPNEKRHAVQATIFTDDKKVSVSNNRKLNVFDSGLMAQTSLIAPEVSSVDPFAQMLDVLRCYGIAIKALRMLSSAPSDQKVNRAHFITPDGVLYYIDGKYSLQGTQSEEYKERIKLLKSTEADAETSHHDSSDDSTEKTEVDKETKVQTKIPSIEEIDNAITFDDIGGLEEAKSLLKKIAVSFNHPDAMKKWGAKRPNGVFFYGPPGTGKTTLAKALANEIGGKLWEIKTSEIFDMWLGNSQKNIVALFKKAREITTPTVMLWDEFESIIPNPTGIDSGASNTENAVVGLFKQEVEKLAEENPNIILMASSNDPERIDEATIRAGRFDEKLYIGKPDEPSRKSIWASKISPLINWEDEGFSRIASDIDFDELAKATEDWVGADITACLSGLLFDKAMREAEGEEPHPVSQADLMAEIRQTKLNQIP